jgi:hypothetical protein
VLAAVQQLPLRLLLLLLVETGHLLLHCLQA